MSYKFDRLYFCSFLFFFPSPFQYISSARPLYISSHSDRLAFNSHSIINHTDDIWKTVLVERELVLRVDRELETNESGSLAKRGSSKCDNRRIVDT